ncbi:TerC family protein [Cohnella yongneupensis]|uniref:TerC family protein n=1 Tax=Cohnella yongneupensis TaxID=425006 RepID=A0ABW0R707_9BACL
METEWLLGLLEIILVNIVLSGDNAVVIAMACRKLEPEQQKKAIFWGTFGAVFLRLVLTFVAVWLLKIPMVEAIGGLLLLYIAVKLLMGEEEDDVEKGGLSVGQAIKTIVIADVIMSLDNVVAVAGVAEGDWVLIGIGLAVSIPLIVWCSQLLTSLMKRFPIIVLLGAALLAYTSGEMLVKDEMIERWFEPWMSGLRYVVPIVFTVGVFLMGLVRMRKSLKKRTVIKEH